jgi:hypothetical protein
VNTLADMADMDGVADVIQHGGGPMSVPEIAEQIVLEPAGRDDAAVSIHREDSGGFVVCDVATPPGENWLRFKQSTARRFEARRDAAADARNRL